MAHDFGHLRPPPRSCWRFLLTLIAGGLVSSAALTGSGCFDSAPDDFGLTPVGGGALVRFDLAHQPLPQIPLPNDVATWADPTSRTGLRINASLIAPTHIERLARERFSQLEGWGTFAPISLGFVAPANGAVQDPAGLEAPLLDLENVRSRHHGDDYDFADDVLYVIDLNSGVPAVLDVGNGNFDYTLKRLNRYWPNDTRASERNILFETIDETNGGAITDYQARYDSDFDGVLDVPNFALTTACPGPDPVCDEPASGAVYDELPCLEKRRARDQCVADNLLTWYERETDTLMVRPLVPLNEMTRYAVVVTDRLIDRTGQTIRSPFQRVFHATQRTVAERVEEVLNDPSVAEYYGDLHGSGLGRVAFTWGFTTQPTVDDMRRLRDGMYGKGVFARFGNNFPPTLEVQRAVGLTDQLAQGASDTPGWPSSDLGKQAGCPDKAGNLFKVQYADIRDLMRALMINAFGLPENPSTELLLRRLDNISHIVVANYRVPFLLEGGPASSDPNAAFALDYLSGQGESSSDTVQVWMIVPRATAAHQQPFDVNIYAHGYTGNFSEMLLYAGNMAENGLATVAINAMGHGLSFGDETDQLLARVGLASACIKPLYDALSASRARDLNGDGRPDSGGDFWSSYLFHTRDGVRQSVLDHIQLVRIMRAFGSGASDCRDDNNAAAPVVPCDVDSDGTPEVAGDFDADGVVDFGGPQAHYGSWGESLGGILSAIHGAVDPYVTSAVPGSGGGGLSDIGVRSFQGGVVEAVLLRLWGPLLVGVPAAERPSCEPNSSDRDHCTVCAPEQLSLRWVLPDINGTGEVEVDCLQTGTIRDATVRVLNLDNDEVRCGGMDDAQRFRVGVPASSGDRVVVQFYQGPHAFDSYEDCKVAGAPLLLAVQHWNVGRFVEGTLNAAETAACTGAQCSGFQGRFYPLGTPLTSPGDGFGLRRQSPELRRFLALAQAALEPGDPISFAPYYALKPMLDPAGVVQPPHALLTLNTIGDMNVPINSGIAFARASGALPFMRPDQASRYPHYRDYVTPAALFDELGGNTPNRLLIDRHVIEGIAELARHPAAEECVDSRNARSSSATFIDAASQTLACFPSGCTESSEASAETRVCYPGQQCDVDNAQCVYPALGQRRCDEALWDSDDLDEGAHQYYERVSTVPHRLARLSASAAERSLSEIWRPRIEGTPFGSDGAGYQPVAGPAGRLTGLLNAYTVPQGQHTFVNGDPCAGFDHGSYLSNLVARFFVSDGRDIYYLSHPGSHRCLGGQGAAGCP